MGHDRCGGAPLADILHFLLVPDKASGRKVRRALASDRTRGGVVVGTFGELLDHACKAYLLKPAETDWNDRLGEASRKLTDAFWSDSLNADLDGSVAVLDRELRRLLAALGPGRDLAPVEKSRLSDRGKRHLADLSRLHEMMGRVLPDDLATIQSLLAADGTDVHRIVKVYRKIGFPTLSPWQEALIGKLATDAKEACDPEFETILAGNLIPGPLGKAKSALRHLQENLFRTGPSKVALDDSVTCLGVRDLLEVAEIAAGMIQRALDDDSRLRASDIGLLLPGDGSCEDAVREVFSKAGLPVSGLEGAPRLRNLGGEAVFLFLATRRRPAPAMALAALYSSPLMPWDAATGNRLAMRIMKGKYRPEGSAEMSVEGRRMMDLLREEHEAPRSLAEALKTFGSLLAGSAPMARHVEAARAALESLGEAIRRIKGKDVPWEELTSLVPQAPVPSGAGLELTREGVALFLEGEEPWRAVRILFVLGFSGGRFPAGPDRSPVFDPPDTAALKSDHGFALETPEEGMARRRDLFLRQLGAVGDRVVFLAPLRDAMGEDLAPSGTITFMSRLFNGIQAPEDLLSILERESHRSRVKGLAVAPPANPVVSGVLDVRDPELKIDLLLDRSGKPRPLSASGFDTLMVSPLAWFLQREDIVPLRWAPEELDPMTKGTLAHEVFEYLFRAGIPLPTAEKIKSAAGKLLNEAILRLAPFLTGTEWYVERRNLLNDVETAALRWRELLVRCGANILGVETSLTGEFEGVPIRGRTDLLLSLPSGSIFVVDYKKSTSRSRRKCMEEGYDLQASLYRRMLRSGKVADGGVEALSGALKEGGEIGVLYYMMDDQRALTDTSGWIPRSVSGVQELGSEISRNGEVLVRERILALRAGNIPLNREDDGETFEKIGVKTYALEDSPLVMRFAHPAPAEEDVE
jgi:RecB family exonuclease